MIYCIINYIIKYTVYFALNFAQVVPTVLPSGTVWDFEKKRLMLGAEQLALQGIQFEDNSQLTNNQQQDLAGNACLVDDMIRYDMT